MVRDGPVKMWVWGHKVEPKPKIIKTGQKFIELRTVAINSCAPVSDGGIQSGDASGELPQGCTINVKRKGSVAALLVFRALQHDAW